MIISIMNQKGGGGKSTISTNLAALFAADGREVILIDADPEQHTSMTWLADRPETLPKIHGAVLPAKNLAREAGSLREKYQVVVIDGGARVTDHSHAAVAVADVLIIPLRPSKADLDASAGFIDIVRGDMVKRPGLMGTIVMNQVQEKTSVAALTRAQLAEWDFPVLDSVIHHRVAFIEALWAGMAAGEYSPKSAAAEDVRKLFVELKECIS
jgi:chromosome partitioning protein